MLVLKFDYIQFSNDLCNELVNGAQEAFEHFMKDALYGMRSKDQEVQDAILDMWQQRIKAQCVFYAQSILESFGRGRQMDETSEYLQDYINSSLWNPARERKAGAQIVGRPKGNYTNILGQTAYSTGEHEGQVTARNVGKVVQPTYSIQNAEKKLEQGFSENGYVMRALRKHAESFLSTMNPSKYFYNEDVSI